MVRKFIVSQAKLSGKWTNVQVVDSYSYLDVVLAIKKNAI